MIGEFYGWDENLINDYGLRQFALIPFLMGLMVVLFYYVFLARKKSFREKMFQRTNEIIEKETSYQATNTTHQSSITNH